MQEGALEPHPLPAVQAAPMLSEAAAAQLKNCPSSEFTSTRGVMLIVVVDMYCSCLKPTAAKLGCRPRPTASLQERQHAAHPPNPRWAAGRVASPPPPPAGAVLAGWPALLGSSCCLQGLKFSVMSARVEPYGKAMPASGEVTQCYAALRCTACSALPLALPLAEPQLAACQKEDCRLLSTFHTCTAHGGEGRGATSHGAC